MKKTNRPTSKTAPSHKTNLFARLERDGWQIDRDRFWAAVEQLEDRPQTASPSGGTLLQLHYRRDGVARQTQAQLARAYGVAKQRISQKEIFALRLLRQPALFRTFAYRESPAELAELDSARPGERPSTRSIRRGQSLSPREREILAHLARQTTLPVAWYSLDPADADPHVFAEYLVEALRRLFPDAFPQTTALLAAVQFPRDLDVLAANLVNEISALPTYFALVLDDFHCVDGSDSVYTILEMLLRRMPENLHFMLASRTVPTRMPLLRLATRQESAGLSADDLRFRVEELVALAQQNEWPNLDPKRLAALVDFAGGWIAGFLLAEPETSGSLSQARPRVRSETQIFDFFAVEVLERETPAVQKFLMQSAVLDELDRATVRALWGEEAVERLLDMERRNLFISRIESPASDNRAKDAGGESENDGNPVVTWCYHALFRHFLLTRFRETAPAEEQNWQNRAAGYSECVGSWDLAIKHYRAAGQLHRAAQVIDRAAEAMMNRGRFQMLAEWIDALPPDRLAQFPNLLIQRGLLYHREGNRAQGEALLLQAETVCRSRGDLLGQVTARVARAETYNTMGRLRDTVQLAQETLQMLSDDDDPAVGAARARLHNSLGVAYARLGELARGQSELEESIRCHLLAGTPAGELATAHHNLGVTLTARGSPDAEAHYLTVLRLYPPGEFVQMRCMSRNALGVVYYYRGAYAPALEMFEPARDEATRNGDIYAYCTIMASLADLHRDQGDLEQARADYREALASARKIRASFIIVYAQTALAELDCRRGYLAAAEEQVAAADEQARASGSWADELLVQLARGTLCVARAQGNHDASAREFRTAAALAERIGARREQVRAELHRAVTDRRRDNAGAFRERNARLARELGETQILVSEAPWVSAALEAAVERGIEANLHRAALQRAALPPPVVPAPVEVAEPRVRVQAFGNGTVWVEGKEIPAGAGGWETTIARDLFFLVLASPAGLRKEQILDALWADLSPGRATENLHRTASRVRGVIPRDCFFRDGDRYRVRRDEGLVYDVDAFERHLCEADAARSPDEQAETLRAAVALYRGAYLEDCYRDWAAPGRARLERSFLHALLRLARLEEQAGRAEIALAAYWRLWEQDEFNEEGVRAIMRLYAQQGQRAGALEVYRQHAETLRRELNIPPSRKTEALYRKILKGSLGGVLGVLANPTLFHRITHLASLAWHIQPVLEPLLSQWRS